jgi:hypothetical protein
MRGGLQRDAERDGELSGVTLRMLSAEECRIMVGSESCGAIDGKARCRGGRPRYKWEMVVEAPMEAMKPGMCGLRIGKEVPRAMRDGAVTSPPLDARISTWNRI